MRAGATESKTAMERKALGIGLVVSIVASLAFGVAVAPLVLAGAHWGLTVASIALSLGAGTAAAVGAALLLETEPAEPAETFELAA